MPSITLSYGSGAATDRTFSRARSVKGFRAGDHHVEFPGLRLTFLNGAKRKKFANFRRIFTVDLGVITNIDDLAFLGLFLINEYQYLTYSYDGVTETDVRVVDAHPEYQSNWMNGVEAERHIVLTLEEADGRTSWPAQAGYGFVYGGEKYGDHL